MTTKIEALHHDKCVVSTTTTTILNVFIDHSLDGVKKDMKTKICIYTVRHLKKSRVSVVSGDTTKNTKKRNIISEVLSRSSNSARARSQELQSLIDLLK
jgi:hypothetical protein